MKLSRVVLTFENGLKNSLETEARKLMDGLPIIVGGLPAAVNSVTVSYDKERKLFTMKPREGFIDYSGIEDVNANKYTVSFLRKIGELGDPSLLVTERDTKRAIAFYTLS